MCITGKRHSVSSVSLAWDSGLLGPRLRRDGMHSPVESFTRVSAFETPPIALKRVPSASGGVSVCATSGIGSCGTIDGISTRTLASVSGDHVRAPV